MRKQIDILNEKIPDFEKKLIKGIIISQIIVRTAKKKEAIKKTETKIICCGLDNAGKTAILSRFGGRLGIQELMNLEPTKKVAIREIETRDLTLWVWDFGGQEKYRDVYLKEPEKYFLETELVLYVIDVQDPDKFNDSFQYFSQILDIFITLEEKPYILVFIHKSDPDLRDDPEFQLNVELLKERVKELFQNHEFEYDVYITSIFNMISSEPKFSKYLKDVLREQQSLTNPIYQKMEGLGKILDSTLNAVIRLSESIIAQHDIINRRIDELEYRLKTGEYPSVSSPTAPPDKIAESNGDSTRATVLNELKELFQKRKKVNY
jgi:GTPase SAR1 family protein